MAKFGMYCYSGRNYFDVASDRLDTYCVKTFWHVDQFTWWKVGAVIVAISYAVHMGIGLPYWKLIGLW